MLSLMYIEDWATQYLKAFYNKLKGKCMKVIIPSLYVFPSIDLSNPSCEASECNSFPNETILKLKLDN